MKTAFFRHRSVALLIPVLIFAAFLTTGCSKSSNNGYGGGGGGNPGPGEVWMQNIAFNPTTINISVNSTVTWTNKDNVDHDIAADDGSFTSGKIAPGGNYQHQFTTAGTFKYHCTIHAGMVGSVVVK